jgi:hypothetical protein
MLLPGKDETKALAASFERLLGAGSERVNVNVNKTGYLPLNPPLRVPIRADLSASFFRCPFSRFGFAGRSGVSRGPVGDQSGGGWKCGLWFMCQAAVAAACEDTVAVEILDPRGSRGIRRLSQGHLISQLSGGRDSTLPRSGGAEAF